jgi:glycosyltransferase involved in cell wall biosynthesis
MRILQVCPVSFRPTSSGMAEHVRNISIRLARKHDVTFYGSNPSGRYPRFEVIDGVKVERFKHFSHRGAYFLSLELLLKLLRSKFDVVHAHGFQAFPMHFSVLAKRRGLVVSPHFHEGSHSPFRNSLLRLFKPFGRRTFMMADKIVCVSEFEKSLICNKFRIAETKVCVIPNGVDFSEFVGFKRRKRDFKSILYVGRLESYKGVQYLINVLPKLDNNIFLEIVGKGPYRKVLEDRAKQLKVYDRVLFFQDLPRRDLLKKYADADVFILLSQYEAYSLAVAEALMSGTPCIVANTSALVEWVDNQTCFGVNMPVDLDELARVINFVLNSEVDKQAMKKWVGTKILDWNTVVERLEKIYEMDDS